MVFMVSADPARSLQHTTRYICVRVCERERERKSEVVPARCRLLEGTYVCVCERETEREREVVPARCCLLEETYVCVYVCEREREGEGERGRARSLPHTTRYICVRETERDRVVRVCGRERKKERESEFVLTSAYCSLERCVCEWRERQRERERKKEKSSQKSARCRTLWHRGFPICMCARIWSNRKIDFLQSRLPPNGWFEMKTTFARLSICNENDVWLLRFCNC